MSFTSILTRDFNFENFYVDSNHAFNYVYYVRILFTTTERLDRIDRVSRSDLFLVVIFVFHRTYRQSEEIEIRIKTDWNLFTYTQTNAPQPDKWYIELKASQTLQEEMKIFDKFCVVVWMKREKTLKILTVKTNEFSKRKDYCTLTCALVAQHSKSRSFSWFSPYEIWFILLLSK